MFTGLIIMKIVAKDSFFKIIIAIKENAIISL